MVVRTVASIVGDRVCAEELAQDAFAVMLVRCSRVRRYDRPGAWVRRVAIRDAVRHLRRRQREMPVAEPVPRTSPPVLTSSRRLEIREAFTALTPRQRAAAVLAWVEDRPTTEVADLLGCREATVRVHLYRARAVLADHLGDVSDAQV